LVSGLCGSRETLGGVDETLMDWGLNPGLMKTMYVKP
jgi:hypothetical protein